MDNKQNIAAEKVGRTLGKLVMFFLIPLILLKLWGVIAVTFTLPVFNYWFWLGVTYVINYFLRKQN